MKEEAAMPPAGRDHSWIVRPENSHPRSPENSHPCSTTERTPLPIDLSFEPFEISITALQVVLSFQFPFAFPLAFAVFAFAFSFLPVFCRGTLGSYVGLAATFEANNVFVLALPFPFAFAFSFGYLSQSPLHLGPLKGPCWKAVPF